MKIRLSSSIFLSSLCAIVLGLSALPGRADENPDNLTAKVGVEQKLGAQLPLKLVFRDEDNHSQPLGTFFGRRPVILVPAYYECPNLCTLVLNALLTSAQDLKLTAGKDYEIVVFSINPRETPALAAAKKRIYTQRYGRPNGVRGWHFLTGDGPAIAQLTESIGFRYVYDPQTKQYAHASAIVVLTPDGKISRYFAGIEFPPKDLNLALVEASDRRIGTLADQIFLFCFHYNPLTGKYGVAILRLTRAACTLTIFALATFVVTQLRREKRAAPVDPLARSPDRS